MSGRRITRANRAAERDGTPWPDLAPGGQGTQVHITGDFRNSDVTIVTFKSYPAGRLLELARGLAKDLGVPTDFITAHGRRLHQVDLEFNRGMSIDGSHSHSRIDVGRLAELLQKSDLPRPIGIAIHAGDVDRVNLDGRRLRNVTLLQPANAATVGTVTFDDARHWYLLVPAIAALGAMYLTVVILLVAVIMRFRRLDPPAEHQSIPAPRDLDEAQSRYERQRKVSWPLILLPFAFVALPASLAEVEKWASPGVVIACIAPVLALLGVTTVLRIIASALRRRSGAAPAKTTSPPNPLGPMRFIILAPLGLLALLVVVRSQPQLLDHFSPVGRRVLIFSVAFAPFVAFAIASIRQALRLRTQLEPGDHIYDTAMRFARLAGARVRRVVILQSTNANAAATLAGSVVVTSKARDEMPQEELDAVIAHEVGHLRAKHVPKIFLATLAVLIVLNALVVWQLDPLLERSDNPLLRSILATPIVPIVIMLAVNAALAPRRRRAEFEADRIALEITGDYATLARSLARIHLLNGSPHTLTGLDAFMASHPSLTKRLARLREAAVSLGMPTPDDVVSNLMRVDPTVPPVIAVVDRTFTDL